jgi:hypothetical protein
LLRWQVFDEPGYHLDLQRRNFSGLQRPCETAM